MVTLWMAEQLEAGDGHGPHCRFQLKIDRATSLDIVLLTRAAKMPNGCKAGKKALFRPSYNWHVGSAVRAKLRTGVFPLCPNSPAQAWHGACPRAHKEGRSQLWVYKGRAPRSPSRARPSQSANAGAGKGSELIHFRLCNILQYTEEAGEAQRRKAASPGSHSHTSQPPTQIPLRQQAATSLPWPTSPILPSSRSDQGPPAQNVFSDPLPASSSLTHLLNLLPLPRMPDLPFGPSKLLLILQGPVQIPSSLIPQIVITPIY